MVLEESDVLAKKRILGQTIQGKEEEKELKSQQTFRSNHKFPKLYFKNIKAYFDKVYRVKENKQLCQYQHTYFKI